MAGTVTVSETAAPPSVDRTQTLSAEYKEWLREQQPIRRVKWSWISDGSGDADQVTTLEYAGIVGGFTDDPGAAAPTDNYNVVINDADGFDILGGKGLLRDTINAETQKDIAEFRYFGPGILNLVVDSAGDAKAGDVFIWIKSP